MKGFAHWGVFLLCACGTSGSTSPDAPPTGLDLLVEQFENGDISAEQFRAGVAGLDDGGPSELAGEITETTLLEARAEPYHIRQNLTVSVGAKLVIEEGAVLELAGDATLVVNGRLYAIGGEDSTIKISGDASAPYKEIELAGGPNQLDWIEVEHGYESIHVTHNFDTRTIIDHARFDGWSHHAVFQTGSSGLIVRNSRFGKQTPIAEMSAEAIGTLDSGDITIEHSIFGPRTGYRDVIDIQSCLAGYWPVVSHNRFEGGEDDAIDLDYGCSAFVIGNYISNFRPADLTVVDRGVNGGGVTGSGNSQPFIANNMIDGCFHGIGFKDGGLPIMVNNTIINSNIGVTLYQSAVGQEPPSGIMINNVLWNNKGWIDGGQGNDIVLNGKWWADYNQVDDVQATIDARFNILASETQAFVGAGNITDDPNLDVVNGIASPKAGSPAIDSGLSQFTFEGIPMEMVTEVLKTDYFGNPRQLQNGAFVAIDRGAVEAQ